MNDINQIVKDLSFISLVELFDPEYVEIRSWEDMFNAGCDDEQEAKDLFEFYKKLLSIIDLIRMMKEQKDPVDIE